MSGLVPTDAVPPGRPRARFHAMVKPGGAQCNLDCAYCFYLSKQDLLRQPARPRMADDLLELHIRQYIEAQTGDQVVFSWQGGEPTLLGLEFFGRVVALQAKYRKPGQAVANDLQTNGTLLNDEWAGFLKQHDFLVGLSVDGPPHLHDRYRTTRGGAGTHGAVAAAVRLLHRHGVPFNILCVVNRENARRPFDVYRHLTRELGASRLQFTPCVEPAVFRNVAPRHWDMAAMPVTGSAAARPGTPESVVTDWSVDPEDWGRFLCKVWDDWYGRDFGKVHVDLFETAVAQSLGLPAQRCVTAEFCGKALAIEHDGGVYACDHFVYPEYRLGNLRDHPWRELAFCGQQQAFGFAKRDLLPQECRGCSFLKLCGGECPKNRFVRTAEGAPGLNYLCPGLKLFFAHIARDMPEIMGRIRGEASRDRPAIWNGRR